MYFSDVKQDEFVANILKFKKNGTYLDIGSCDPINSNNSYFFESQLNWRGICIEYGADRPITLYKNTRNCGYYNLDARTIDYIDIFKQYNMPQSIDYLSLDVDTSSLDVLKILPREYRFKCITIEHDAYLYEDTYRSQQRSILSELGYYLLCANVYVEMPNFRPNCPFEDWWVDPQHFDINYLNTIRSDNIYPTDFIKKLKIENKYEMSIR